MEKQKKLAIISFSIVMACLLTAIVSNFVIFAETIFTFFIAIFASCFIFLICLILLLLSIVFVFGIFILENQGFWPLDFAIKSFDEIMSDATLSSSQIATFIGVRIGLLVLCIAGFVLAIIALHKKEKTDKLPLKGMSVASLIFSILGILMAIGTLVISFSIM